MNNENNSFNNGQNVTTTPVVPNTVPVSNINQMSQPVVPNTAPAVVPTVPTVAPTVPAVAPVAPEVLAPAPVAVGPTTTPVAQQPMQAYTTPIVEPTTMPVTEVPTVPQPVDNNAMVNENLKKVEIQNYNPPSKFKVFVLFLFFALLVAFIIFLPQISSYIRNYGKDTGNYQTTDDTITSGRLVCTLTSNTSDLDKEHEFNFSFTDSKLKRTKYIVYTRGDTTTESALDELNEKCVTLKENTSEIEGVSIKCDYSDGKLVETQIFELETVDNEKLTAAFTEAGGMLPSYKYDQSIDDIETNMKASGYSCERQS